jgi:hypothetical protein
MSRWPLLAAVLLTSAAPLFADEVPRLRAGPLPENLHVDGVLDEPAWEQAEATDALLTTEPVERGTPTGRTVVRVLAGPGGLAFGIWCQDPEPARIVTFTKERDGELESEDHVKLVLGSFQDGRSGYVLAVNPGGARYDALVASQGEGENANWDGIWQAATRRDETGWWAEILIPIETLSFDPGLDAWQLNVERRIQRVQETIRWASPSRDYPVTLMSRAGLLSGLPRFDPGLGLSVRPAVIAGAERPEPESQADGTGDVALDVTKKLGGNLSAALTVNTDFAETEVDTRQTNLTRFPLFYPEKRTFFLEAADIWEFGLGSSEDVVPFFSRRIGLVSGYEVPILAGLKLSGRVGETNLGGLVVRTREETDIAPATTLGTLRLRQNVLSESSVGVIATAGDPLGAPGAWTAGADFTFQTSRFRGDKNLLVGVWGLAADRAGASGDRTAFGLKLDYPNDLWDNRFLYKRIGDGFDPALGFVPRRGVQKFDLGLNYMPRPESSWIRQLFFEFGGGLVTDLGGRWESYEVSISPFSARFESGDAFHLGVGPGGERLLEPFEIADGVVIPAGSYHWVRYALEVETAAKRRLSGEVGWASGGFYGGTLDQVELEASWTPSSYVTLLGNYERSIGRLPEGDFDLTLVGLKLRLNLTPDIQINSFVQYDTESASVGTNTRLRWTFHPQGELFVIYNHNLRELDDGWQRDSDLLQVKLQYAFRR